jgi:hypothetical protein
MRYQSEIYQQAGTKNLRRWREQRAEEASYQHGVSPEQPSSDGGEVLGFISPEEVFETKPVWRGMSDNWLRKPKPRTPLTNLDRNLAAEADGLT